MYNYNSSYICELKMKCIFFVCNVQALLAFVTEHDTLFTAIEYVHFYLIYFEILNI